MYHVNAIDETTRRGVFFFFLFVIALRCYVVAAAVSYRGQQCTRISLSQTLTSFALQLLRDIPFTAIFWSTTEPTRRALAPPHPHHAQQSTAGLLFANMTAAGCAGAVAAATTTPLDVIKTHQQIAQNSTTLWQTAKDIHARRGLQGFLAGVTPRSLRAVPAGAIVVSTYELLKAQLAARHTG